MILIKLRYAVLTGFSLSLLFLMGCNSESVDSEDVQTSGIWAKMEVDAREDQRSRVVVELNVGGEFGTNVELSDGEYLEVEAGGVIKRLDEDTDIFDIDYQAYMDIVESDTLFTVSFYRSNGENIVDSTARLPTSFVITSPLANTQFGLSENVLLTWSSRRNGQAIHLYSSVTCTNTEGNRTTSATSFDIDDDGQYEFDISSNNLFANGTNGLNTTALCDLNLKLEREGRGVIDSAFDSGGEFKIYQSRKTIGLSVNLE